MGWIILSLRHLKSHGPYLWVFLIISVFFDFGATLLLKQGIFFVYGKVSPDGKRNKAQEHIAKSRLCW